MITHLVIGLLIILIGAEVFTNAVEWFGKKLRLTDGAVGSLLAAVGTALPETMIPIIAFFSGDGERVEVGIGAILGAPFMLGTLALFITGFTAFLCRKGKHTELGVGIKEFSRDLLIFIAMYMLALSATFIQSGMMRMIIVVALVIGYLFYVAVTLRSGSQIEEDQLKPLYLGMKMNPSLALVTTQLVAGLGFIVGGAHAFVSGIDQLAVAMGISPLALSLVIAPIATELPEKFNSVLWVLQGKDRLALGNITGAMIFQSTLIPAFGIAVTPWNLNLISLYSGVLVLLSTMTLYLGLQKYGYLSANRLMACGGFYFLFFATVIWSCS